MDDRDNTSRATARALAVAWEQVDWAISQGWSLDEIYRRAELEPPPNPTLKDAVKALAQQWQLFREFKDKRADSQRAKLGRLEKLRGSRTPLSPIVEVVCAEVGIGPEEFFSASRSRAVVQARREVLVRALSLTAHTLPQIAGWLGLDRTTAIYHRAAAERSGRFAETEGILQDLAPRYLRTPTPESLRNTAALVGDRLAALRRARKAGSVRARGRPGARRLEDRA